MSNQLAVYVLYVLLAVALSTIVLAVWMTLHRGGIR